MVKALAGIMDKVILWDEANWMAEVAAVVFSFNHTTLFIMRCLRK